MLIDSQQIHHPDKPEDDVQAVNDASCGSVGIGKPTHRKSQQEECDGEKV